MELEKYYVKDYISADEPILKFASLQLQEMIMNKSFTINHKKAKQNFYGYDNEYWANEILCKEIFKHDVSLICTATSDTYLRHKHIIAKIAFKENNKEIIEQIHRKDLDYNFLISHNEDILSYGYRKHGSEFIRYLSEIGVNLYNINFFSHLIDKKDNVLLNYLLDVSTIPPEKFFRKLIGYNYKGDRMICLITLFIDRIDMVKHQSLVFKCICDHAMSPVDAIKLILDYGITINSNEPLRHACISHNIELMEFFLQYGLKADLECLEHFFSRGHFNEQAIKILLKYDTDFSVLKVSNPKEDLFIDLENHGLDKSSIIAMLLYPKKLK